MYIVYKTTNKINDKIYIGCHKTNNIEDKYLGSGELLKEAIREFGRENFTREIIAASDDCSEMNDLESKIITLDFVRRKDTYNLVVGGGSNYVRTESTLRKQSEAHKNLWKKLNQNLELKKKWNEKREIGIKKYVGGIDYVPHFLGKKHTEETKKKMSEKAKIHAKGERNSQYGTHWIHNLKLRINKKIKKEELDIWLEKGWIKGREMEFLK